MESRYNCTEKVSEVHAGNPDLDIIFPASCSAWPAHKHDPRAVSHDHDVGLTTSDRKVLLRKCDVLGRYLCFQYFYLKEVLFKRRLKSSGKCLRGDLVITYNLNCYFVPINVINNQHMMFLHDHINCHQRTEYNGGKTHKTLQYI